MTPSIDMVTDYDFGIHSFEKSDASKGHKQKKSSALSDHCCITHHCCSAKIISPLEVKIPVVHATRIALDSLMDQTVSSVTVNNLERPPKNLA